MQAIAVHLGFNSKLPVLLLVVVPIMWQVKRASLSSVTAKFASHSFVLRRREARNLF